MKRAAWLLLLLAGAAQAQPAPLELTLQAFIDRGAEEGLRALQSELSLESAGYAKRVVFHQTSLPSVTAGASALRGGGNTDGAVTKTQEEEGSVTVVEQLPTGTSLSATARRSRTQSRGPAGLAVGGARPDVEVTAAQPLYLFVRNPSRRSRKRASLRHENARDSARLEGLMIRFDAARLYYDVLEKEEALRVELRKTESARSVLQVSEALVEAGKLAAVDAARAQLRLRQAQRQFEALRSERDKALLRAKDFLRLPLEQPLRLTTQLSFEPFDVELERLVDHALRHRPEVKALRRARELAELDLSEAKEPTRPTLSLIGAYGDRQGLGSRTRVWSWGANASWQLFDGFVTRDRVKQAALALRAAELNLEAAERATRLEVQSAYLDVAAAQRQLLEFRGAREEGLRNLRTVRTRFQNGMERLIDVFDAETEARALEREHLDLLVSYNLSKQRLSVLIGTDLEVLP